MFVYIFCCCCNFPIAMSMCLRVCVCVSVSSWLPVISISAEYFKTDFGHTETIEFGTQCRKHSTLNDSLRNQCLTSTEPTDSIWCFKGSRMHQLLCLFINSYVYAPHDAQYHALQNVQCHYFVAETIRPTSARQKVHSQSGKSWRVFHYY